MKEKIVMIVGFFLLASIGIFGLYEAENEKYICDDNQISKVIDEYMSCKEASKMSYSKSCFDNAMNSNCAKQ